MIFNPSLQSLIHIALCEDLPGIDVTTEACVPENTLGKVKLVARESLVVCGVHVAQQVFQTVDPTIQFLSLTADGARIHKDQPLTNLEGSARSLLVAERVALNLLQHLSGVATATRQCVDAVPADSNLRITDTRKTLPGLRALQRYAVRCGGGFNHRNDLTSAVLIKDNHVAAAGGIKEAIERCRRAAPHTTRITCEVDTFTQFDEALTTGADVILLDNFSDDMIAEAVTRNRAHTQHHAWLEVSGNVTVARVPVLARLGVDSASLGSLTHSVRAVDIGLDWHGQ